MSPDFQEGLHPDGWETARQKMIQLPQFQNASDSIVTTLSGMIMLLKLIQPWNTPQPIYVTPSGSSTF
jgi:hypothetical protein